MSTSIQCGIPRCLSFSLSNFLWLQSVSPVFFVSCLGPPLFYPFFLWVYQQTEDPNVLSKERCDHGWLVISTTWIMFSERTKKIVNYTDTDIWHIIVNTYITMSSPTILDHTAPTKRKRLLDAVFKCSHPRSVQRSAHTTCTVLFMVVESSLCVCVFLCVCGVSAVGSGVSG